MGPHLPNNRAKAQREQRGQSEWPGWAGGIMNWRWRTGVEMGSWERRLGLLLTKGKNKIAWAEAWCASAVACGDFQLEPFCSVPVSLSAPSHGPDIQSHLNASLLQPTFTRSYSKVDALNSLQSNPSTSEVLRASTGRPSTLTIPEMPNIYYVSFFCVGCM